MLGVGSVAIDHASQAGRLLEGFAGVNLILMLYNVLPAPSLDGGLILGALRRARTRRT